MDRYVGPGMPLARAVPDPDEMLVQYDEYVEGAASARREKDENGEG